MRGSEEPDPEPGITLGNKLPNAYSVANMQAAYNRLHSSNHHGNSSAPETLSPTHLYVKLTVEDTAELSKILNDTTIDVYPYPLDYELIGTGFYTPANPYELYAVVPVGWNFGTISYVLLEQCIIPDDDDEDMIEVEIESLRMAGYPIVQDNGGTRCWGQAPSGRIKVYNTQSQEEEGVNNVKVKLNTLVRVRNVYTSETGAYSSNTKFYTNVNYTVYYDNKNSFRIWDNNVSIMPAMMGLGVHSAVGYNYTMWTTSAGWRPSTVNNAVCIYKKHLASDFEIPAPPNNLRISLISFLDDGWGGSTPMFYHRIRNDLQLRQFMILFSISSGLMLALPDMFIMNKNRETVSQYANVFHEMSHVSHYMQVGGSYWSCFVGDIILNEGYGDDTSSWLSERVGISEMWGYYAEGMLEKHYWSVYGNDTSVHNKYGESLWFKPSVLHDITETVFIGTSTIFGCLQPNVTTFNAFNQSIKNQTIPQNYGYIDSLFSTIHY